jgi:hypothetical protein
MKIHSILKSEVMRLIKQLDVTTSRVMGNCNSITEITEGKIYSNCQNLNV